MQRKTRYVNIIGAIITAFIAAGSTAPAYPRDCVEINWNPYGGTAPDGDYVVEPTPGVVFTVYCKGMGEATTPKAYLTLQNTGGDFNYSRLKAGVYWTGTDVRTSFTKIRIDPKTLLVDIGDLTFATSTGQAGGYTALSFGVAASCNNDWDSRANVDLSGTPFEVFSEFAVQGYHVHGIINETQILGGAFANYQMVEGQVLTLRAGGYCGAMGPSGFNSMYNTWFAQPTLSKLALQLRYIGS